MEQPTKLKRNDEIVFSAVAYPKIHFERQMSDEMEVMPITSGSKVMVGIQSPITLTVIERKDRVWLLATIEFSLKFEFPAEAQGPKITCELAVQGRAELKEIGYSQAKKMYENKISKKRLENIHQTLYAIAATKSRELVHLMGMGSIPIPINLP